VGVSPGEQLSQAQFASGAWSLRGGRAKMLHLLQQQTVTRFLIPTEQSSGRASEGDEEIPGDPDHESVSGAGGKKRLEYPVVH